MSDNVIIATSKEEKEKLLNIRIEQIKKKNEELLNKHKLIEEDKRQAELKGRILKNNKSPICEDNEPSARRRHSPVRKSRSDDANMKQPRGNGIPVEPAYNFLFDKMRDGPNGKEIRDRREITRRHPRNYGGMNFEDVPMKIQEERARQNNHRRHYKSSEVDYTMVTTGKERREMDEWRKEREEIDRKRIQRQRKEDGGWRREWDQNKEFMQNNHLQSGAKSSANEQRYFAKMWNNKGPHYNKIYHQKKKIKRNASESNCTSYQERSNISSPEYIPNKDSHSKSGSSDHSSLVEDQSRGHRRQFKNNNNWKSWKANSDQQNQQKRKNDSNGSKENSSPASTPQSDKVTPETNSLSSSSSPRKSVRFLDADKNGDQNIFLEEQEEPAGDDDLQQQQALTRTARNFIGSGRFSAGQKFRPKGHKLKRDIRSEGDHFGRNQIRKVYLNEAMCKTVEVVINPSQTAANHHGDPEVKKESHKSSDDGGKPDESVGKSDEEEYEEGEDEDEQWEDIDEEVCLELDHGRDDNDLDASSESLDKFIINNTLVLDASESISNSMQAKRPGSPDLLDGGDASMGPQGGYPSVLDWEDDAESISHLSDVEKTCNVSESSVESGIPPDGKNDRETGLEEGLKSGAAIEDPVNEDSLFEDDKEPSVTVELAEDVIKVEESDSKEENPLVENGEESLEGNDQAVVCEVFVCEVVDGSQVDGN